MAWSNLVEALLLITGGLVLLGVWASARRRDRQATQALRVSEERFRHLTTLSADWFWETDRQHRVSWLSGGPAVTALFGGEMAHGRRLWEVPGVAVEPRALVEHFERLEELDAQMPFFDFLISRSDAGERRAHRITGKPRYDAAGKFLGYRGVGTGHHREAARRARAERRQGAAGARHRGPATWRSGTSTWAPTRSIWASGWAEVLGAARVRAAQHGPARAHPSGRPGGLAQRLRAALKAMARARTARHAVEFRMRTVSGDWLWLYCSRAA